MTFEKYCQKVNISEVKKIDAVGLIMFFLYKIRKNSKYSCS